VSELTPEIVSEILRDPDSPYFPCQIGVYCDDCCVTVMGDYLVHGGMSKPERLSVARTWLVANKGWQCDGNGDFCPKCIVAQGPES